MKVRLHAQARAEFFEAVEYYANESTSAPERFIAEFEEAAREIGVHPHRYRTIWNTTHQKEFHSFPYSLVYRILDDIVQIDAVPHDRQRTGYWKKRV